MKERLQKIISSRGIASRRQAEEMIRAGRIMCNGKVCFLGDSADPDVDEILLDGKSIPKAQNYVYLMLNKPRGYVTTLSDEKNRKTVADLVADCGVRVYPVGRLDMDSDGLLLLTNDGEFANSLMHPKKEIDKVYRVAVKGYTKEAFERLKMPVELDGYQIRPPKVTLLREEPTGKAVLTVTIHEGRNRQVRRMCAIAGMQVSKLTRICEGGVRLGDLKSGTWRYLSDEEIKLLKH